nr:4'-phosphopantetheinyl transferase superfamily protein [Clostridia bacterium]
MSEERLTVKFIDVENIKRKDLNGLSYVLREDFERADGYEAEEDKVSHVVSAYLKRKYVGEWETDKNGKPYALGKYFNISHGKGAVVFIESVSPVGIDIEKIRRADERLKRYISSDEEFAYIKDDGRFFEIWTAKESLAKAFGTGVSVRAASIPALPVNGVKSFNGEKFFSRCVRISGYVVSITRRGDKPFDAIISEETLS